MCYRNFLFDLYGTLADIHTNESKKALWASLAGWYRAHGAQYSPWRLRRRYLELAEQERKDAGQRHPAFSFPDIQIERVFQALYREKGVSVSADAVAETALFFRTLSRSYIRLYPQIRPMLAELRRNGKRCILLSNAQAVFTIPELKLLGIDRLFDDIFISSMEECAKPDTHFYALACERCGLDAKDTLMVGNDLSTDIAGAKLFGIDSVYIHSNLSPRLTKTPDSTYAILNGDTARLKKLLLSF